MTNNRKNTRKIGNLAEDLAIKVLVQKGYKILDRNYHCGCRELDIIATENNFLVFIEVKYRKNLDFMHPIQSINKTKKLNLFAAAEHYLAEKKLVNTDIRFDVVEIIGSMDCPYYRLTQFAFSH